MEIAVYAVAAAIVAAVIAYLIYLKMSQSAKSEKLWKMPDLPTDVSIKVFTQPDCVYCRELFKVYPELKTHEALITEPGALAELSNVSPLKLTPTVVVYNKGKTCANVLVGFRKTTEFQNYDIFTRNLKAAIAAAARADCESSVDKSMRGYSSQIRELGDFAYTQSAREQVPLSKESVSLPADIKMAILLGTNCGLCNKSGRCQRCSDFATQNPDLRTFITQLDPAMLAVDRELVSELRKMNVNQANLTTILYKGNDWKADNKRIVVQGTYIGVRDGKDTEGLDNRDAYRKLIQSAAADRAKNA